MFKITLSPGHGINTPGKRTPDGMHEWEFNSAVVSKMIELFAHYKDVAVKRLDDPTGKVDIPLDKRVRTSNDWGANYHLDVHANAAGNGGWYDAAHGIETFSYKMSGKSFEIAKNLQKALVQATGLSDRGVQNGDWLYMVKNTKSPANLVECGFMTNHDEAKLLKSDAYREKVANALVLAIADQFDLKKEALKPAPKPTAPKADGKLYKVQVGAFSNKDNAEKLLKDLANKGHKGFITHE